MTPAFNWFRKPGRDEVSRRQLPERDRTQKGLGASRTIQRVNVVTGVVSRVRVARGSNELTGAPVRRGRKGFQRGTAIGPRV